MERQLKVTSFWVGDADRWGEELEALLLEVGLSVAAGSELERMCLAPAEILNYVRGSGLTSAITYEQFLDTATVADLATRLLQARDHPSFPTLVPHLELLNEGDPRQAGRSRPTDQAARKSFELFAALMAMQFSESVELEHPVHGSDGNPDVVLDFEGRRWGIACKVPVSSNPESLVQNLERAVDQIVEAGVDAGVPLFNLKNVLSPELYWQHDPSDPDGLAFRLVSTPEELPERAISDAEGVWREVQNHVGAEVFEQILVREPCVPVVLSYVQILAPVVHADSTHATTSRFVACYQIQRHRKEDEAFFQALHTGAVEVATG